MSFCPPKLVPPMGTRLVIPASFSIDDIQPISKGSRPMNGETLAADEIMLLKVLHLKKKCIWAHRRSFLKLRKCYVVDADMDAVGTADASKVYMTISGELVQRLVKKTLLAEIRVSPRYCAHHMPVWLGFGSTLSQYDCLKEIVAQKAVGSN